MAISRRPARFGRKAGAAPARGRRPERGRGYILTVVDGPHPGKEYYFESTARIGRVEENEIVLVEPGISRHHARVVDDHGVFLLEDMGSANGTRLNGEQVSEAEVLRDGDYLTLSQTTLQFSLLSSSRGDVTARTTLTEEEIRELDRKDAAPRGRGRAAALLASRRGRLALVALVIALAAGAGLVLLGRKTQSVLFDQSGSPLVYSEEDDFFNAVFGNSRYDRSHVDQVTVEFDYLGGRATLQYGAWGVDKVGEVAILLNGKPAGQAPLTMNRWTYGLKLDLPRGLLRRKEPNRVTFDNARNPPNADEWAVCYIQILQEAIPPADPQEARQQFELAKKAWEDREIEPANMYSALVGFKKARDLLEALPEKPELYQESVDFLGKVDRALTRRFEEGLFDARRAEKLDGDPAKARELLTRTRRYFHKEDFRFREIQRYLDSLVEE